MLIFRRKRDCKTFAISFQEEILKRYLTTKQPSGKTKSKKENRKATIRDRSINSLTKSEIENRKTKMKIFSKSLNQTNSFARILRETYTNETFT